MDELVFKSKCPNCGHKLPDPDWRCPECYYDFSNSDIKKRKKSKQTLIKVKEIIFEEDYNGICDVCSADMPPSGGIFTAEALKVLAELDFDFFAMQSQEEQHAKTEILKKLGFPKAVNKVLQDKIHDRLLNKELGDYALCPKCFKYFFDFVEQRNIFIKK